MPAPYSITILKAKAQELSNMIKQQYPRSAIIEQMRQLTKAINKHEKELTDE